MHRVGAKPLVTAGMVLGIIAMVIFTRLSPGGSYASHVLPGLLVIGLGMGCIFAPAFGTATLGVSGTEAASRPPWSTRRSRSAARLGRRC